MIDFWTNTTAVVQEKGLKWNGIAKGAKISVSTLHTMKTNDRPPRLDVAKRIADQVGESLDRLTSGKISPLILDPDTETCLNLYRLLNKHDRETAKRIMEGLIHSHQQKGEHNQATSA